MREGGGGRGREKEGERRGIFERGRERGSKIGVHKNYNEEMSGEYDAGVIVGQLTFKLLSFFRTKFTHKSC